MNTDKKTTKKVSAPETRTWQVVEDDKSKDYFVAEYANGLRQQINRNPRSEDAVLAAMGFGDALQNNKLALALAKGFSRVLRTWLSATEIKQVNFRNSLPKYEGCCASHDFCDANMAMDEAFTKVVGRDCTLPCDDEDGHQSGLDTALWNAAWDIAIKRKFFVDEIGAVGRGRKKV